MQMVLCTYGLSRFLQTRPEKRKGRLPYILLSFAILALSATSVGISLWLGFRDLYYSAPGVDYVRIRQRLHDVEMGIASMASMYGYVVLGDGLLEKALGSVRENSARKDGTDV
ncbi:hypothetical protein CC1G_15744 [Coprinopsis cinerea okayama7|uniref:Uncharacterized protein n=1 Tax=Coprinopsis cinerea (strain Okayama-7 / 130 / ATCC MYA-4618 / FGSC 9003) TaxID=240176 RepID=D6RQJ1_COPC7|nr:hypothetical protein CC1G_15744 [Coprinopsis cinerea okayama7\|eukprot:XP_002910315.1 hypothetical protein CC1G_15744 [Coprinopsis cinerea okayama7\